MIRFHFELTPLPDVGPWGGDTLHWFGLTDGRYWIEVDGNKLLHHPDTPVDYYVVRLWEDIQELLPHVLEPVPADLAAHMTDLDPWYAVSDDEDPALSWLGEHCMYTSYLVAAPDISWWRTIDDEDTITVDWRHRPSDGVACALPSAGRATVPTESFLRAVEDFDRELIAAMDHRVAEIEAHGLGPTIQIDVVQLRREHEKRAASMAQALRRTSTTDWTAVREGAARIFGGRSPLPFGG